MADASQAAGDNLRSLKRLLADSADILVDGSQQFAEVTGPKPVLFLGAGFSAFLASGSALPRGWQCTWEELLHSLANESPPEYGLELTNLLNDKGFNPPFETLLGFAEMKHSQAFLRDLRALFYSDGWTIDSIANELERAQPDRWRLACELFARCGGVVTTNYDPLAWVIASRISQVVQRQHWGYEVIDKRDQVEESVVQALVSTGGRKLVVYLHGGLLNCTGLPCDPDAACDRLRRIVLTDTSYAEAYFGWRTIEEQSADQLHDMHIPPFRAQRTFRPDFISRLFMGCSLLFIGYSMNDYLIQLCMTKARMASKGEDQSRHFAILYGKPILYGDQWLVGGNLINNSVVTLFEELHKINPIIVDALSSVKGKRLDVGEALEVVLQELDL